MNKKAIQIVQRVGDQYELDVEALRQIIQQNDVLNKKVAVLAVAGAFRKGKSFFLSNCVRYLQCKGRDWMSPTATVEGFTWRQSPSAVTEGILMWPEPFIVKNAQGEEMAILLLDTEGAFDSRPMSQTATVFALSALLSSVLIFNVPQDIQEDTLSHLEFFCSYGTYVLDEKHSEAPFQSLMCLVRDWQNDNHWGIEAGRKLWDEKLKCQASFNASMKSLRDNIKRSFIDRKCWLLPDPGSKIRRGSMGSITVNDMDPEFQAQLSQLVPYLFEELLQPKKIGGKQITGADFLMMFSKYIEIFASGTVPEPKSIFDATAAATHQSALTTSFDDYNTTMKRKFSSELQCFDHMALQYIHHQAARDSIKMFTNTKKMGHCPQYLTTLKEQIEERFKEVYQTDNDKRIMVERMRKEREDADKRAKHELAQKEREKEEMILKMKREKEEDQKRAEEEQERKDRSWKQQLDQKNREQDNEAIRLAVQLAQMKMTTPVCHCVCGHCGKPQSEHRTAQRGNGIQYIDPLSFLATSSQQSWPYDHGNDFGRMLPWSNGPSSTMSQDTNYAPSYSNANRAGAPSGRRPGRPHGGWIQNFHDGKIPKPGSSGEKYLQKRGFLP